RQTTRARNPPTRRRRRPPPSLPTGASPPKRSRARSPRRVSPRSKLRLRRERIFDRDVGQARTTPERRQLRADLLRARRGPDAREELGEEREAGGLRARVARLTCAGERVEAFEQRLVRPARGLLREGERERRLTLHCGGLRGRERAALSKRPNGVVDLSAREAREGAHAIGEDVVLSGRAKCLARTLQRLRVAADERAATELHHARRELLGRFSALGRSG